MDISSLDPMTSRVRGGRFSVDNSCGSLSRLPDELLGEISFQVVRASTSAIDLYSWPADYIYIDRWTVVLEICRRWRQVALNTPRFWTTLTLPCPKALFETVLRRSGRLPLTVIASKLAHEPDDSPQELEVLVSEMVARTKYLQLRLKTHFSLNMLSMFSSSGASDPPLEALTVKLHIAPESAFPALRNPVLVKGPLPHLRHLTFYSESRFYHPPSELPLLKQLLLPSLTSLHLNRVETLLSVDTCLDLLKTLPNLEDLILGRVLSPMPATSKGVPSPSSLIHLAHIRTIHIQSDFERFFHEGEDTGGLFDGCMHAADLLRHLAVPSSAEISLAIGEMSLNGQRLDFVCGVLCDAVSGRSITILGPSQPLPTICRVTLSYACPQMYKWVIELSDAVDDTNANPSRTDTARQRHGGGPSQGRRILRAEFLIHRSDFFRCLKGTLKSFSTVLSAVTSLHHHIYVEDPVYIEAADVPQHMDVVWRCFRESMPQLRDLSLLSGYSAEFIRWLELELDSAKQGSDEARTPLFAKLQSLSLDGSEPTWRRSANRADTPGPRNSDRNILDGRKSIEFPGQLVSTLQAWTAQFEDGRTLQRLTFETANLDNVEREALEQIKTSGVAQLVEVLCTEPLSRQRERNFSY